ncbi:hypothetical protein QBC44DRAFT_302648 [Cladorrhinum sp. PSN332]|nr:hypothetical protein QBC44DRAFT_302648 [Cladorrhinum sp. PSN332]
MLGVNLDQLASEMKKLTGNDIDIPAAPFSSLYYTRERNAESGRTEVHTCDASSSYAVVSTHNISAFLPDEWKNGTFDIDNGDLYYIKVRNTESGKVEIHRVPIAWRHSQFDLHSPTAFTLGDADNGRWTVGDRDLYFIKTKNCASGMIEVHRASHKNYNALDIGVATSLPQSEEGNGTFIVFAQNLYFIKYRNAETANVEIHKLGGGDSYKHVTKTKTWFNVKDGGNGTWDVGPNGDLYFIKTKNCESGKAEVHIALAKSKYQEVYHYASGFGEGLGPDGTWCVR